MRIKNLLLLSLIFLVFSCKKYTPNSDGNSEKRIDNITANGGFTCARHEQKIKCWGYNDGRLGDGTTFLKVEGRQSNIDSIAYVKLGDDFTIKDIKSGLSHTCALSVEGAVKCWGNTSHGYLGQTNKTLIGNDLSDMGNNLEKISLGDGFTVTKIFEGGSCAQIQSGDIKCWGRNDKGQLGLGDIETRGKEDSKMGNNLPTLDLGQTFDVKKIVTTKLNTCALSQNGKMKCWGSKDSGVVGNTHPNHIGDEVGEMGDNLAVMNLGTNFIVSDFDLYVDNVCAISTVGKLLCWGKNDKGQLGQDNILALGDDDNELGDNLTEINLGLGFIVKQVQIGFQYVCALSTTGNVLCWGRNDFGQLGYDDTTQRGHETGNNSMGNLSNVDLGSDFIVSRIEMGVAHSCVISSKYKVKCWGSGTAGKILTKEGRTHVGNQVGDMGNNLSSMVIFND